MRGRKPKPPELKALSGSNPSGHDRPLNPPDIEPQAPLPPPELKGDALAEWEYIVPRLDKNRILEPVNRAALVLLCEAWAEARKADAILKKTSYVIKSPKGYAYPNPWLAIRNKAQETYLKLAVEFGLTPSARARLHVPPAKTGIEKRKAKYLR